jgi:hypothetical protein
MNERYRRLLFVEVLDLLEGLRRNEIIRRAFDVIALWRTIEHMDPYYDDRWSQLLGQPTSSLRTIVLSGTDEGEKLLHCMPFAGIIDNRQRAELRRAARVA